MKPDEVERLNGLYAKATPAPLHAEKGQNARGRFIDVYGTRAGDDFVASAMTPETARRMLSALHFDLDQNAEFMVALWNAWPEIHRALTAAPVEVPRSPTKWNHGCNGVCANIDLWIDRCPHCGMPRPSDAAPKSAPVEVPREPTEAMVQAGYDRTTHRSFVIDQLPDIWRAMYDAAPKSAPIEGAVRELAAFARGVIASPAPIDSAALAALLDKWQQRSKAHAGYLSSQAIKDCIADLRALLAPSPPTEKKEGES